MKFRAWIVMVAIGILLPGWGLTQSAMAKNLQAATSQAGVAATDNQVQKSVSQNPTWQNCQVGDILKAGDKIRTGSNSSASLLLADQSVMRMGANTELQIVDLTEQENGCLIRRFQLSVGRVFADVTPGAPAGSVYEVKGPNAVAAVHGTAFELDSNNPGGTDVKVWDGAVDCRGSAPDAKPELVKAGGSDNQFRANAAGAYERSHFVPEHADAWQTENLKTRQAWRKMTPGMGKRLSFNQSTFQQFHKAHFQMSASQRRYHQQRLTNLLRNYHPTAPNGGRLHPNQGGSYHPFQRHPVPLVHPGYQHRYVPPTPTPKHPRRRWERER